MTRCRHCVMPNTRPDTAFEDGLCSACASFAKRKTIDWGARAKDLERILAGAKRSGSGYDCIVPSSGGKDSHWQVMTLLQMGVRPLVVTAATCQLTPLGRRNIENLARYATTLEYTPNRELRRWLNRSGLEMVGDVSWPEHAAIWSVPMRIAIELDIPLIFYGENPQNQYGGPKGTDEARQMTLRWVHEFGGFNGMRPLDMVGKYKITEVEMRDYMLPSEEAVKKAGLEIHFLGAYLEWDSLRNAELAKEAGFQYHQVCLNPQEREAKLRRYEEGPPCPASLWAHENLDNAQTGLHDHFMYRKFGYGRLCAQASVDVRHGRRTREDALELVAKRDGLFPHHYAGVDYFTVLAQLGISDTEFDAVKEKHTNASLFHHEEDGRPILHEFNDIP